MYTVKLDEAPRQLRSLIDAAIRGEVVLITTDNHETIQLIPVKRATQLRAFGSAKGLIHMDDDFDAPLDDFREYMARKSFSTLTVLSGSSVENLSIVSADTAFDRYGVSRLW